MKLTTMLVTLALCGSSHVAQAAGFGGTTGASSGSATGATSSSGTAAGSMSGNGMVNGTGGSSGPNASNAKSMRGSYTMRKVALALRHVHFEDCGTLGEVLEERGYATPKLDVRMAVFDAERRVIETDADLETRRQSWQAPPPRVARGVLAKYAKTVGSAARGAVIEI